MNFLLHRHVARAELGSGPAGIGAMLPDLWRMADRRMRAHWSIEVPDTASPQLRALMAGIDHHLRSDRDFHRSELFRQGEARGLELFRRADFRASKMVLFAHPAWELCLDGALLLQEGLAPTLESIRTELGALAPEALHQAARLHRPKISASELEALGKRLEELLRSIAEGEWIGGYRHSEGLAGRLLGLRRRLGLPTPGSRDRDRLEAALAELLALARARLPELPIP